MKNKVEINKSEKDFDTVKHFRAVKESISKKIYGMSLIELKAYFKSRKLKIEKA